MVRDVASFKLWAQAIQAMLQEGLNVQCNLRTVVEVGMVRRYRRAGITIWRSAPSCRRCSTPRIISMPGTAPAVRRIIRSGTIRNSMTLVDQIDREVDPAKRLALVRQTEAIMEEDPPVLPVAWEKINDVWYNYVKGLNPYDFFGVYDVVRQDTVWLDKT